MAIFGHARPQIVPEWPVSNFDPIENLERFHALHTDPFGSY